MQPVLFEFPLTGSGSLPVSAYALAMVLGFLLAVWLAHREGRRRGLPPFALDFGLILMASGLLGARALYYAQNYRSFYSEESFLEFFRIWRGGLAFYGGAASGLLGGSVYLLVRRLSVADCLDAMAPGIPAGLALGRLGCFLRGCCFGRPCGPGFPLGVVYPRTSSAHLEQVRRSTLDETAASLAVHPVQLYQSAIDLALFVAVCIYIRSRGVPRGAGVPGLMVLYGAGRFLVEEFRGDDPDSRGMVSQWISAVAVLAGVCALATLHLAARNRSRTDPERRTEKWSQKP